MSDPQFFPLARPLSIAEICKLTGAEPVAGADLGRLVAGVAPVERAGPSDICFVDKARFLPHVAESHAAACLCRPEHATAIGAATIALVTPDPQRVFALVVAALFPGATKPLPASGATGISPLAAISPDAILEPNVTIEPFAVIGAGARIGRAALIGPSTVIGPGVAIGSESAIGAQCTIINAMIGERAIIHPGTHIGHDGFGFVPGARGHLKIPQIGRVVIGNDVEIGTGTTIDRGAMGDTRIGDGTKIDNQVHIAHNVTVGRFCLIAGQVGLAGSAVIGDFVAMGGKAGISDHITVGNGAQIGAASAVFRDVPAGEKWAGYPAMPLKAWLRSRAEAVRRTKPAAGSPED